VRFTELSPADPAAALPDLGEIPVDSFLGLSHFVLEISVVQIMHRKRLMMQDFPMKPEKVR
jgi:hypothetical protein